MADDDDHLPVTGEPAPAGGPSRGRAARAGASSGAAKSGGRRTGPVQFMRECREELRRVQWPNRHQLANATVVVLVVSIVVGTYLWGLDQVFSRVASWLIRQQAG